MVGILPPRVTAAATLIFLLARTVLSIYRLKADVERQKHDITQLKQQLAAVSERQDVLVDSLTTVMIVSSQLTECQDAALELIAYAQQRVDQVRQEVDGTRRDVLALGQQVRDARDLKGEITGTVAQAFTLFMGLVGVISRYQTFFWQAKDFGWGVFFFR
ncbi:hypothetical protein PMIN06_001090 [Paraphaeosphaeria minitans]|uniref:Uncharacterized protein n=1 Tax=Paraphaeosphaeria minitans TaxID=565426 RepID=A0A9P6GQP7_9PLEO|nr:hypothetical protein PMIN01_02117 [Paraphaeosphaeria minitans]